MAKKKDKSVASKRTMNLAVREKTAAQSAMMIPMIAAIVLAAALVGKFGVADRLAQVSAARREVDDLKSTRSALQATYTDYAEVEAEYNRYTYKNFDDSLADRMDVLALVEREVIPVCQVQRLSLAERRLDLALEGSTLGDGSALVARLEADPLVESAYVTTATATAEDGTLIRTTNMTVMLTDLSPEPSAAPSEAAGGEEVAP